MHNHDDHGSLVEALAKEYSEILDNSDQGVYIYLDDTNKVCNENFASLLGYSSPDEWARIETNFPEAFVADESQEALVTAYQAAMEQCIGSTEPIVWKKKDGTTVKSTVILVPIVYEDHLFALHFVAKS
jgi:PAS domain-containing protein